MGRRIKLYCGRGPGLGVLLNPGSEQAITAPYGQDPFSALLTSWLKKCPLMMTPSCSIDCGTTFLKSFLRTVLSVNENTVFAHLKLLVRPMQQPSPEKDPFCCAYGVE